MRSAVATLKRAMIICKGSEAQKKTETHSGGWTPLEGGAIHTWPFSGAGRRRSQKIFTNL